MDLRGWGSVRLAEVRGNARMAAELGLVTDTVRKSDERFSAAGVAGLADGARPGRPKARPVLTNAERDQLTRWARRENLPGSCAAGEDRAGLREQRGQQAGRHGAADHRAYGGRGGGTGSSGSAWPG